MIKRVVQKILKDLGYHKGEISILFVDNQKIRELNKKYRHRDSETDVLSFSMLEGEFSQIDTGVLGDIVVSVEKAQQQAEIYQLDLEKELNLLLVHGILHLIGFDHEKTDEEAALMRAKEEEILGNIYET